MAKYETRCPHCDSTLSVSSEWEGMELACPLCSKSFTLPRQNNPENSDGTLILLPKTSCQEQPRQNPAPPSVIPQQVVPQQVIPQQVIPQPQVQQQYPGYRQPSVPPQVPPQQYPGVPPMPPAQQKKGSFFTSSKFFAIIIALLLLIIGIFIINAFRSNADNTPAGTSIAVEKKRHKKTVQKLEERYIASMIEKSKVVKTYDEAFSIMDQLAKNFPASSARSKIDARLQELEKSCDVIIFEAKNNYERTYMIFNYSADLEQKFKTIKAGFYKKRDLDARKHSLSRSQTQGSISRYEQQVTLEYLFVCEELKKIIDAKQHLFFKSHTARRYTVAGVPPGKYIWIAFCLKTHECWWGKPEKVKRKNVLYNLD
ncbi:MAG: hypothetical protein IKC89_06455 [Lentisphaeria bacterium]|nr:hypothetical protein [Lentisphaeria bacterium]